MDKRKIRKRIALCVIILLVTTIFSIKAKADDKTLIYGDKILENADESFMVTLSIKNNKGLMGCKIHLKYNPKELSVKGVTMAKDYSNGIVENNIGLKEDCCDILWTNTKEVKADGDLLYIRFTREKEFKEKSVIEVSYSKEDTFNEKYEDVQIECENIEITGLDNLLANTSVTFEDTAVQDSVEEILVKNDAKDIVDVIESIDQGEGHEEEEHGALDDESRTQNILVGFHEKGIDVSAIEKLDGDKKTEAIKKLYEQAKKEQKDNKSIKVSEKKSGNWIYIFGIVGIVTVIAIVIGLIGYRKYKSKKCR